uniref:Tm0771-like C-terminal domain-containing protein n=1 Tax=Fervidobacterium pennivorans TaxID=93466 RepID=A0A7V4KF75_FERPE
MTFEEIKDKLSRYLENGKSYGLVVPNKAYAKALIRGLIEDSDIQDLMVIEPDTNIGIDEVRTVIEFLDFSPKGEIKKVILYDADKMTQEAANAFLKTLEEPPSYAILILVTSRWFSLLPTIRSRLQKLQIQLPIEPGLDEFERYLVYWNYDFLEPIKKKSYSILSEEEFLEAIDEIDEINQELDVIISLKHLLEQYLNKDLATYVKFISQLSKKSNIQFLRIVAKVISWLIYKNGSLSPSLKIKYLRICDEILKAKIANFNYQLTYYTLLLGLRGDNL